MPIPQLPDDVLSHIFSHLFLDPPPPRDKVGTGSAYYDDESDDKRPPKVRGSLSQSTLVLLVSRRFRSLAEPFVWRRISIDRSSDFPFYFTPKTGLLHATGATGKARRGWVRELVIGRNAAIPYDTKKIDKQLETMPSPDKTYDLHVKLASPKLPNLRRVVLGETAYLLHWVVRNDPSFHHLWVRFDRLLHFSESEPECSLEDVIDDMRDWFWALLARHNDDLITELLSPYAASLTDFQAPFAESAQGTDHGFGMGAEGVSTLTARIPSTLKNATNLRVVLRCQEPKSRYFGNDHRILPSMAETRALAALLPADTRVEVHETQYTNRAWMWGTKPEVREELDEWANWKWVDLEGQRTRFGPEWTRNGSR